MSTWDRPETEADAEALINKIRRDRGNVDANDKFELSKTSPEWQADYQRREEKRRNDYARYTKTVADQLYTSKFRFIQEILQNADDAEYTTTAYPELTFRVRPTELIIDSNERGFTRANVQAICSTGESSKLNNLNTTGEKGLGFKSIFGVANIIHIQSGLWSFRFEHSRGEDGLGMVTPIWTPCSKVSAHVGTRFRLSFAQQSEAFVRKIVDEFDKLADTIVFALRQINVLNIVFENVDGRNYTKTFSKTSTTSGDHETIAISTAISGGPRSGTSETLLRTVRTNVLDLPQDELRSVNTSEVVLGFQVSSSGEPIIPARGQHVFAYLPVTRVHSLPFLVQANFILAANREAIPDNDWNLALVQGVAKAFEVAVRSFCRVGDALLYRWMEYIPFDLDDEDIWGRLYKNIDLVRRKIIASRSGIFKTIETARALPKRFQHEGEPLLPDLSHDTLYISESYSPPNIARLKRFGLADLTIHETLARVTYDVENSNGRLRNTTLEDAWHTSFLEYIEYLLGKRVRQSVLALDILPLTDGTWTSPSAAGPNPVYLPYAVEEDSLSIEIPETIGLRKLHTKACVLSDRRSIYANLGISQCPQTVLISKIRSSQGSNVSGLILDSVRKFEILFWYAESLLAWPDLIAIDHDRRCRMKARTLFFRSDTPLEAVDLLGSSSMTSIGDYGFLHDMYAQSVVRDRIQNGLTWISWLENVAGVRYWPTLLDLGRNGLHPLLKVAASEDSSKFSRALKERWSRSYATEYERYASSTTIRSDIRNTEIVCLNGKSLPLSETVLPLAEAIAKAERCGVKEHLSFISLGQQTIDSGDESWNFLRRFGVLCDTKLDFHFRMLDALKGSQRPEDRKESALFETYNGVVCNTTLGHQNVMKAKFISGRYICGSLSTDEWYAPDDCLWDGPDVIYTRPVLSKAYDAFDKARELFVGLLKIRNADALDVLDDLKKVSALHRMPESLEKLRRFYSALHKLATPENKAQIRHDFDAYNLVYAQTAWIKPSQAVWNCTVPIAGLRPIGETYPGLKEFFLNTVGVRTMDIKFLLQQLIRISSSRGDPDREEVKGIMMNAGQILATKPDLIGIDTELVRLSECRYLPVARTGNGFVKEDGKFFIVDHERFGNAFKGKVDLLDFTYEDLTSLHPFFETLELEDRYLSAHVKSETKVNNSSRSQDLTDHMQQRAYALSCCAIAHQSHRYFNQSSALHKLLLSIEVFVSDDMWTDLIVRDNGGDIRVRSDRALVKVEETQDSLRIFAPSDGAGLYSCFRTELPRELSMILGIQEKGADKKVYRLLSDEQTTLSDIMRDEDIPKVSWLDEPATTAIVAPVSPQAGIASRPHRLATDGRLSPSSESESTEDRYTSPILTPPPPAYTEDTNHRAVTAPEPSARVNIPYTGGVIQSVVRQNAYRQILERVVRQARTLLSDDTRPGPPQVTADAFSMANLIQAVDDFEPITLRNALGMGQNEPLAFAETAKLGAAGELFVFERLQTLGIPEFGLNNWQSTIRHNVNALPDYDLPRWSGSEVSDIVYETSSYALEGYLRQRAFNRFQTWPVVNFGATTEKIRYLLEVKTTTGSSSTPFFMSSNQYRLMEEHKLTEEEDAATRPKTVYVIFRVHNVASGKIGLQIFVDPWHLRGNTLKFSSGSWTVTGP